MLKWIELAFYYNGYHNGQLLSVKWGRCYLILYPMHLILSAHRKEDFLLDAMVEQLVARSEKCHCDKMTVAWIEMSFSDRDLQVN